MAYILENNRRFRTIMTTGATKDVGSICPISSVNISFCQISEKELLKMEALAHEKLAASAPKTNRLCDIFLFLVILVTKITFWFDLTT